MRTKIALKLHDWYKVIDVPYSIYRKGYIAVALQTPLNIMMRPRETDVATTDFTQVDFVCRGETFGIYPLFEHT